MVVGHTGADCCVVFLPEGAWLPGSLESPMVMMLTTPLWPRIRLISYTEKSGRERDGAQLIIRLRGVVAKRNTRCGCQRYCRNHEAQKTASRAS